MDKELAFEDWVKTVPSKLRADPLWESLYYRLAIYLFDLVWQDVEIIRRDFRGREIVGQLVRCAGSNSANMEESYGRGLGSGDFVRIIRIAFGEACETQGWYFRSRHILESDLIDRRIAVIDQIISLLVNLISRHRKIQAARKLNSTTNNA